LQFRGSALPKESYGFLATFFIGWRMHSKHFEKKEPLGESLDDFLISVLEFEGKRLVSFKVLQIQYSGEEVHEILKYDTSHGYCHVHRYYKRLNASGEPLSGKEVSQASFEECRADIKKNWQKYKAWYLNKWLG
jgi:hypothetical protein